MMKFKIIPKYSCIVELCPLAGPLLTSSGPTPWPHCQQHCTGPFHPHSGRCHWCDAPQGLTQSAVWIQNLHSHHELTQKSWNTKIIKFLLENFCNETISTFNCQNFNQLFYIISMNRSDWVMSHWPRSDYSKLCITWEFWHTAWRSSVSPRRWCRTGTQ